MKITELPKEFTAALPVLEKITAAGYEAYFVGGSVRDVLLGQEIHDVDIATSAFPAEVKEIFPRTVDIGIQHGTVLVLAGEEQYEITTFRTESTYQDFRRPDHVEFVRSLEEDLKRRDFTINAFALKEDGQLVDIFDGLTDLETQTLRAVGAPQERFHEDALRMMRGLRFVSQLGFRFDPATFEAILANHRLLEKISVERINVEFTKLLLGAARNQAINLFVETECYEYCPGLRKAGEGLLRFAALPEKQLATEVQAWALLLERIELTEMDIRPFLKAWKSSNELIDKVRKVFRAFEIRKTRDYDLLDLYHLGEEAAVQGEELLTYLELPNSPEQVKERYQALPIHDLKDLALNGHDLLLATGRKPGKWLKEVLTQCEAAVVTGELANEQADLLEAAQSYLAQMTEKEGD